MATVGYLALALNRPTLFSHAVVVDYVSNFKTPDELIDDMLSREHDPHGVFGWDGYELLDTDEYELAYPKGIEGDELRSKKTGKKTKQRQSILQAARVMHAPRWKRKAYLRVVISTLAPDVITTCRMSLRV